MTSVQVRPVAATSHVSHAYFHRALPSAVWEIAAVGGVVAVWAVIALFTLSITIGMLALCFAIVVTLFDAEFATASSIDVTPAGVRLGFWHRAKAFGPKTVVLTHDVRSGRFTLRRAGARRTLVRFSEDDGTDALRAFLGAGVEIISR